jgi:hypothetical protein
MSAVLAESSDAKTFKAANKKLGIMSRQGGFGLDGEWSWTLLTEWRRSAVALQGKITAMHKEAQSIARLRK